MFLRCKILILSKSNHFFANFSTILPKSNNFCSNFALILPKSDQFYPTESLLGDAAALCIPSSYGTDSKKVAYCLQFHKLK